MSIKIDGTSADNISINGTPVRIALLGEHAIFNNFPIANRPIVEVPLSSTISAGSGVSTVRPVSIYLSTRYNHNTMYQAVPAILQATLKISSNTYLWVRHRWEPFGSPSYKRGTAQFGTGGDGNINTGSVHREISTGEFEAYNTDFELITRLDILPSSRNTDAFKVRGFYQTTNKTFENIPMRPTGVIAEPIYDQSSIYTDENGLSLLLAGNRGGQPLVEPPFRLYYRLGASDLGN